MWKAANGDTVEAFYEGTEGNMIALKTPVGKVFKIPATQLIRDDQQWILANKWPGTGAIYTPPSPSHLPSYADGKWKGMHAVYEHAHFDAMMNDRGHVTVYPKKDGKRVGKSLSYGLLKPRAGARIRPISAIRPGSVLASPCLRRTIFRA